MGETVFKRGEEPGDIRGKKFHDHREGGDGYRGAVRTGPNGEEWGGSEWESIGKHRHPDDTKDGGSVAKEGVTCETPGNDIGNVVGASDRHQPDSLTGKAPADHGIPQREGFLGRSHPVPSVIACASVKSRVGEIGGSGVNGGGHWVDGLGVGLGQNERQG